MHFNNGFPRTVTNYGMKSHISALAPNYKLGYITYGMVNLQYGVLGHNLWHKLWYWSTISKCGVDIKASDTLEASNDCSSFYVVMFPHRK